MKINGQKSGVRSQKLKAFTFHLLPFTVGLLLLTGCNGNITGSADGANADLGAAHADGPDCTQSGCHPGLGAGGTVFMNLSSSIVKSGVAVKAQSISTGEVITFEESGSLGNFHYHEELSGYYNMAVGNKPWSRPHSLPDWNGCNSCHTWPPAGGAYGKLN